MIQYTPWFVVALSLGLLLAQRVVAWRREQRER